MQSEESTFLSAIVDKKLLKILAIFAHNPDEFFHINAVAARTGVPLASCFRIINRLRDEKILETRQVGKLRIYRMGDTPIAKYMKQILGGED